MKQIVLTIVFSLLCLSISYAQGEAPDYANNTYNVTARDDASALWYAIGEANLDKIVSLKVTGTINGWDIMVLNNKLPNLKYIDLSDATIVKGTYEFHEGVTTKDYEVPAYAFENHTAYEIIIPKNTVSVGKSAFSGCPNLSTLTLPEGITEISDNSFLKSGIRSLVIPESVTTIGYQAFYSSNIQQITIPKALKWISSNAFTLSNIKSVTWNAINAQYPDGWGKPFEYCNLSEIIIGDKVESIPEKLFIRENYVGGRLSSVGTISIPSSVKKIGDEAFAGCPLTDVYTYTIEPTTISEYTFKTFKTATLHIPKAAYYNYYWAEVWCKFQKLVVEDGVEYDQFYINNDYNTNENTGTVNGTPNVEMGPESGWSVGTNDKQNVDTVFAQIDGDKGSSIITNGDNFHANRVDVAIKLAKGQWHFFCFPFDVDITKDIEYDGDLAICEYDGKIRAEQGSNGWKFVEGNKLQKFKGYIIQGSEGGEMHVKYDNVAFADKDENLSLQFYGGKTPSDDGWNLIGNPYMSYYSIKDLVFDAPVLVWDRKNMTYTAYRGKDDEYRIAPFEGFFVQASKTGQHVGFLKDYRQTYQNKNDVGNKSAIVSAEKGSRRLIDIELTDGERIDKTRIVFNESANSGYELGVDMEKMMSQDITTPQIYTIHSDSEYAINERPMGDGSVMIGVKVAKQGTYTFSASKVEGPALLTDNVTGKSVDLAESPYEVSLEAGEYTTRFTLNKNGVVTGVEEISGINANEVVDIYDVAGRLIKKDAIVKDVYTLSNGVYILKGLSGVHKVVVK